MKRVGMFVWNAFTNDARVLRECTTLSENNYSVDLYCIYDDEVKGLKKTEIVNGNFTVFRLKKNSLLITLFNNAVEYIQGHNWLLLLTIILTGFLLFLNPLWTSTVFFFLFVLSLSSVQTAVFRLSLIFRMIMKAYKGNHDIYHANDLNTLPQAYICSKIRMQKRVLIYDSHEVQTSRSGYDSEIYNKLEKFLVYKADRMLVENDTRAKYNDDLYGFYPAVLHNYPFYQDSSNEKIDLHKLIDIDKNEKILLYQGGLQIGRGLENLIDAFPMFEEGVLVFIGDGKLKDDLRDKVSKMKLNNKIKFIDKVPLNDLPKYTRNAYLGFQVLNNICFNHYSASSNKLFEYMMSEVPVIACDFPEIGKVVKENNVGLTVDSHDPIDIARGVNTMLSQENLRKEFSENCISARKRYNWEQEQKHLLDVYKSIM